jgi:UDP-glucose 4-epimerase
VPFVAQVAIGKLSQLNIFGNDYDTRDYIHVIGLAKGRLCAIDYCRNIMGVEAGNGYSVLEVVKAFEKAS